MKNSRWSKVISLSVATFLSATIFGVFWVFLASVLEPEEYGKRSTPIMEWLRDHRIPTESSVMGKSSKKILTLLLKVTNIQ